MANIQRQHEAGNDEQPDFQVAVEALTNIATPTARIINVPAFNQGNRILEALDKLTQGVNNLRRELQEVKVDLRREIQKNREDIAGLRQQLGQVQEVVDGIGESVVVVWAELETVQTNLAAVRTDLMQEAQRLRAEISRQ